MSDQQVELIKLGITACLTVVLLIAMTWLVLSPQVSDELSKGALVIISSTVGFVFGRETAR